MGKCVILAKQNNAKKQAQLFASSLDNADVKIIKKIEKQFNIELVRLITCTKEFKVKSIVISYANKETGQVFYREFLKNNN